MADVNKNRNEVTVPLGSYLYIQDGTSGRVKTHVGPTVVTMTGNDSPVVYEKDESGPGRFIACDDLGAAIRSSSVVPEGFYAVLMNPAKTTANGGHPQEGPPSPSPDLDIGHKIVIEGPKMFALWPGQYAKVIRGHSLRSNQYLLARVYNEKEARANWSKATIAAVKTAEESEPEVVVKKTGLAMPEDLTVGTLFIIKGTDVSFYVPPTGISVVQDERGVYTRDAVSLEQLEYCILVDEDGTKRIPRGPDVIFPHPTEVFVRGNGNDGKVKYRAIELNEIQGIHIKVTRAYHDNALDKDFKEGDEFFLTGKECPIYFPREEHALIRYDGKAKHFGTAIPSGEARYVMKRNTGEINTVHGPAMLLPDPTTEVIVRRILSDRECSLWYPGNQEALLYNRTLSELAKKSPTTRSGTVSEGEAMRAAARMTKSAMVGNAAQGAMYSSSNVMQSLVSNDSISAAGDELDRSSSYTAPRTLTLNTKFEGVPRVNIYTGYAVMVVNSKGERRVEIGPKTILLEYDETLEILSLSTGKPKTTEHLLETPYLRIMNNKVADIVQVETSDHVVVDLKVSYHINFIGEPTKWWDVQNYIKHACDHNRSELKGAVRLMGIEAFYANPLRILREVVLGETGGHTFDQNGMRVTDVELMYVAIPDNQIRNLIIKNQSQAVERTLALNEAKSRLYTTVEMESITLKENTIKASTQIGMFDLAIQMMVAKQKKEIEEVTNAILLAEERYKLRVEEEKGVDLTFDASAARKRKAVDDDISETSRRQGIEIATLKAEADTLATKFASIKDGMGEALLALSSNQTLEKIAEATSVQRLVGGSDAVAVITKLFEGTGLDKAMKLLAERSGRVEVAENTKLLENPKPQKQ